MRISLYPFVEELVRRMDNTICANCRPLDDIVFPLRIHIGARGLLQKRLAEKLVDSNGCEVWKQPTILERSIGNFDVDEPTEFAVQQEFRNPRLVLLYVEAIRVFSPDLLHDIVENLKASFCERNRGLIEIDGRERNGLIRWRKTELGGNTHNGW